MAEAPTQPSASPLEPGLDAALRDPVKRSQLNPIQIAQAFQTLRQAQWSDERISRVYVLFSEPSIRQYRKFLNLPSPVVELIRQNKLGNSQAQQVTRLLDGHKERIEEVATLIVQEGMSARDAKAYIEGLAGGLKAADTADISADTADSADTGITNRRQPQTQYNASAPPTEEQVNTPVTADSDRRQNVDVFSGTADTADTTADSADTGNGDRRHPQTQGSGEYPLLRDTVNFLANILIFWGPKDRAGDLAVRWAAYFQRTGWLKAGLSAAAIALAGYGGWQAARNIQSRAEGFWWRLRTQGRAPGSDPAAWGQTPVPLRITAHYYIAGRRMALKWTSLGSGFRYRIYWNSADGGNIQPVDAAHDVTTPGAVVDVNPVWKKGFLTVTAIGPGEIESPHTAPVLFEPSPVNRMDSVEPLPRDLGVIARSPNRIGDRGNLDVQKNSEIASSPPRSVAGPRNDGHNATAAVLPKAPEELHATVITPDLIELRWRPVGPGYVYNAYSSGSRSLTPLRKENGQPLKGTEVEWIPETGLDRYWMVVTAVDPQGRESAYSEAIEVIRYPEKTPKSGGRALERAVDVLKDVVPWR